MERRGIDLSALQAGSVPTGPLPGAGAGAGPGGHRAPAVDRRTRLPGLVPASRVRRLAELLFEGRGWSLLRPIIDALAALLAVLATLQWPGEPVTAAGGATTLLLFPLVLVALMVARGNYRRRLVGTALDDIARVASGVALAMMVLVVVQTYFARQSVAPGVLVHLWLLGMVLVGSARVVTLSARRRARAAGLVGRRTLVVGAGVVGQRVARKLLESPEYGLQPIGFIDAEPPDNDDRTLPVLGGPADLDWIAQLTDIDHVVIAFSATSDSAFVPVVRRCEELGLGISMVPRLFDALNDRTSYQTLGGLPIIGLHLTDPRGLPFAVKHVLDRALAAVALLVLAPVMLLLALGVRLSSPGPILFRQRRMGRDARSFDLLKFRSMKPPPEGAAAFVPVEGTAPGGVEGDDRRTRLGRIMRATSLDELPQFINVLRGDMSLVGPRPERPEYVERFRLDIERYGERHRVKAGITGWAQVHGLRGQTSIVDRAELDNFYIEHWSLWLDLKILLLTVKAVLSRSE